VAKIDRIVPRLRLFPLALTYTLKRRPKLGAHLPLVLHETMGRALPGGARAAGVIWGLCQNFVRRYGQACVERAGIVDRGAGLADAMFQRILESPSGTLISVHQYEDTWNFIKHRDGRVHLAIPELLNDIRALAPAASDQQYPLVLQAGERRSYNANTIYRETSWRKQDPDGALKVHPQDAERLGLHDGGRAWCESPRAAVCVRVAVTDEVRPDLVSLPHGFGMFTGPGGDEPRNGPAINFLTESDHCDWLSKVPFHKHVRVRVVPIEADDDATVGEIRQCTAVT
jgi:anaerobic selenocysteine-containing dehydrogenase